RRPMPAKELLQAKQAVVHLREALGAALDPLRVAREGTRGLGQLEPRALDGARERGQRGVDLGRALELARDARELVADGPLALVEPLGRTAGRPREALRMTEACPLVLEILLLPGLRVELVDLAELEDQKLLALGATALGLADARQLGREGGQ